jgi:protease-4
MTQSGGPSPVVVYQNAPKAGRWFLRGLLYLILLASIVLNFVLILALGGLCALNTTLMYTGHVREIVIRRGTQDKVAVIPISGLVDGAMVEQVRADVQAIEHDPNIKAVVLRVDSPGGGVTDADECYHELLKLRMLNKPIVVSMGSLAASGAYYISMAAQEIYAEPTTITGSIGVMMPGFQLTGLMKKIGVQPEFITSKPAVWKEAGSPFSQFTPQVKAYIQHLLDIDHRRFESIVQKGRGSRLAEPVAQIANGKIWAAQAALKKGLVDHIGYLSAAYHWVAKKANIYNPTIVELKPPQNIFNLIKAQGSLQSPALEVSPKTLFNLARPRFEYLCMP